MNRSLQRKKGTEKISLEDCGNLGEGSGPDSQ